MSPTLIDTSEDSYATLRNSQRKLVRTSDGTLYATYFKKLNGYYQIYVKRSVDNGATWIDETRISTYDGMEGYDQKYPSIAINSSDLPIVVWSGKANGYTTNDQIWSVIYFITWSNPVRISIYAGMEYYDQGCPAIMVDSNDYQHAVWYGCATGYTAKDQIWYAINAFGWETPVRISTYDGMESYGQYYPSITVDSLNYLHVVWWGSATGYTARTQSWYTKFTTSWVTPVIISTADNMYAYDQYNPSIAVGSNNYLHVTWSGRASGYTTARQIWYATYTTSWVVPVCICTATGMWMYNQDYPSIAVDSSNYLYVVWNGEATDYTDYVKVWYATYITSWTPTIILQATGQNTNPNLRWSRYPESNHVTTRLDYVFTEGTAGPYNVMFNSGSVISVTIYPGLYDENGNPLLYYGNGLSGSFFIRVLENRNSKYGENLLPAAGKSLLQGLGTKNRLYLIEMMGFGINTSQLAEIRDSAFLIPGVEGSIITSLTLPDSIPVTFLGVEAGNKGDRPLELKINVKAVERITGSA